MIEVLVVVVLVGVLLSIVLPALSMARTAARRTKSEANARTLVQAVQSYADSHNGRFPIGEVGAGYPATDRTHLIGLPSWYENVFMWPGVIYDTLPYEEHTDVYLSPLGSFPTRLAHTWPTSYFYSSTFMGDPRIWTPGFVADPSLLRAVGTAEVVAPSGKAMIWDNEAGIQRTAHGSRFIRSGLDALTAVGFADASVRSKRLSESNEPVWARIEGGPGVPASRLCNTAHGVRGTDY